MILIDGKKAAAELRNELKKEVAELKSKYNSIWTKWKRKIIINKVKYLSKYFIIHIIGHFIKHYITQKIYQNKYKKI